MHLVDEAEPPTAKLFFFSQPFYTFLDKSSLENYLTDKISHKRGQKGVDSKFQKGYLL